MKTQKLNLGLVVLLLGFGLVVTQSAFTAHKETKNIDGYLFRYKLNSYTLSQIQNIANYERSDESCPTGEHVCGVYLATDQPLSSQPDADEFDAAKEQLWDSEVKKLPEIPTIIMRN